MLGISASRFLHLTRSNTLTQRIHTFTTTTGCQQLSGSQKCWKHIVGGIDCCCRFISCLPVFNLETNGWRAAVDRLSVMDSFCCQCSLFFPRQRCHLVSTPQGDESTVLPHVQLSYLLLHFSVFHYLRWLMLNGSKWSSEMWRNGDPIKQ